MRNNGSRPTYFNARSGDILMKTEDKYIWLNKKIIKCDDLLKWARWFEKADRQIAKNIIGIYRVSTVFLGIDHRFGMGKRALLFETMIFGGEFEKDEEYQERCETYEEALAMHKHAVHYIKNRGGDWDV